MADAPYFLIPLAEVLPGDSWPSDVVASESEAGSVLGRVFRAKLDVEGDASYLRIDAGLLLLGEIVLPIIPFDQLALVIGAADRARAGIRLLFELGTPPPDTV